MLTLLKQQIYEIAQGEKQTITGMCCQDCGLMLTGGL